MNDDWRVQVICPTTASAGRLADLVREGGFEHDLGEQAGERVIVSADDDALFLYAGTRAQAERAAEAVKQVAAQEGITVRTELRRWHPTSEEWADADLPLPADDAALAAEHAELLARERAEAATLGYTEYEVRVQTRTHHETTELARKLREEGIPSVRRWRYLLVGAADEDAVKELADRISALAPVGSEVTVEASSAEIAAKTPPNPFAVFGGLGG